ncbi:MAG: D-ribose pyranase [Carnobacterium sp.]|uniref:D-ribose pyranase n=1 Tax=Carnobacterium antarcticum TaxID=2126436 RepID=A0ABW4NRT7_9LACT|nr:MULTISPECIES: D-ribose pyranase [unclassified Carnobacterium]ALV21406.1 Ribose ABC transport system, high affinity permease RbsD [Carnobacterium sp. CP1]QQP69416.1 D-ribose pyranase [Carnobacterium sp. CS13]
MKKNGILNSEIDKVLADLGHTDQIIIADAGLPIPDGVKKIDLALALNDPAFQKVLDLLVEEMVIEEVMLADEIKAGNPKQLEQIQQKLPTQTFNYVSHEEFKNLSKNAKAIIRTGEATPYSNIILQSGVLF